MCVCTARGGGGGVYRSQTVNQSDPSYRQRANRSGGADTFSALSLGQMLKIGHLQNVSWELLGHSGL